MPPSPPFDAYYKWLGIAPREQPPHFYRLLGINAFEEDLDVIERGANQRMTYVRTLQSGEHAALAERLMNELATARLTLLNPQKKAQYDHDLHAQLAAREPAPVPAVVPTPSATPAAQAGATVAGATVDGEASASSPPKVRPAWQLPAALVAAAAVLGIAAGLGGALLTADGEPTTERLLVVEVPAEPAAPALAAAGQPPGSGEPRPQPAPGEPLDEPQVAAAPQPAPADEPESPAEDEPEKTVASAAPSTTVMPADDAPTEPASEAPLAARPTEAEAAEAIAQIKEVFKTEYAAARQPAEKQALAKKLLQQAREADAASVDHYALLDQARGLAVSGADYELAASTIDTLSESFEMQPVAEKGAALQSIAKLAKQPAQHKKVSETAASLSEEALAAADYDTAKQLNLLAVSASRKAKDNEGTRLLSQRTREIESQRKLAESSLAARATLQTTPDDPAANLTVGRFLCLVQQDWEQGLPLLQRGGDGPLQELVARDLENPSSSEERVKLGDAWWDLGKKESEYQVRALHWYELAIPDLTGLAKARLEKRLDELATSNPDASTGLGYLSANAVFLMTFEKSTVEHESDGRISVQDVSGHNATPLTGSFSLVSGIAGQAARFSDSDRYWSRPSDSFPTGNEPRTLSCWLRDLQGYDNEFVSYGATREGGRRITFGIGKARGKWRVSTYNDTLSTNAPVDAQWHHHCLVHDGQQMTCFIDGQAAGSKSVILQTNSGPITMGGAVVVDEVALFDRVLTEREIRRLYQMGKFHRPLKK